MFWGVFGKISERSSEDLRDDSDVSSTLLTCDFPGLIENSTLWTTTIPAAPNAVPLLPIGRAPRHADVKDRSGRSRRSPAAAHGLRRQQRGRLQRKQEQQ